jgi:hypothetical protein
MTYRLASSFVLAASFSMTLLGCQAQVGAGAPPPAAVPAPAPPPPPCDVLGSWQAVAPVPFGPQQIDIAPGDRPGVFNVRAHNGGSIGVGTVQNTTGVPVDTAITNPVYQCKVGPDCNTLTCAFTGGLGPSQFKRMP